MKEGLHVRKKGDLSNRFNVKDGHIKGAVQIKEGSLADIDYIISQLYLPITDGVINSRMALKPRKSEYISHFEIQQVIKENKPRETSFRIFLKEEKKGIEVISPFSNILLPVFQERGNEIWENPQNMYLEYDFDLRNFTLGGRCGKKGGDEFKSNGTITLDELILFGLKEIPIQINFDNNEFTLVFVHNGSILQVKSPSEISTDLHQRIKTDQLMLPIEIKKLTPDDFESQLDYILASLTGLPLYRFMMRQNHPDLGGGAIYSLGAPDNNEMSIRLSPDGTPYLWVNNQWVKAYPNQIYDWVRRTLNKLRSSPKLYKPTRDELKAKIDSSFLIFHN